MSDPLAALETHFRRLHGIEGALAVLTWDQAVWMPPGGAAARGLQVATLRRLAHDILTAGELGDLLEQAAASAIEDPWRRANLREMRRLRALAVAVDPALVEAAARATTQAELVWREARERSDFAMLRPHLEEVLALERERARQLGAALDLAPYDALLGTYQPGLRNADLGGLLAPLERHLPHLVDTVLTRQKTPKRPRGPFPKTVQKDLAERLMARLGFDFAHGRLDESTHPFCGGTPTDIRITTRYDEADAVTGLMGVLHETGHALYEAGLPRDWLDQPVGAARGMAVHESQSLLIEMQVCRSRPFLTFLSGEFEQAFGGDPAFIPDNLVRLYNRVERSFIRVDADELTYPLHVVLRWRLERAMIEGELEPADLPTAWNAGMRELLGVVPPDDHRGVLRDIHLPFGLFGYFPCYTGGARLEAQLFRAARAALPDLPEAIAAGEFGRLLGWLREKVHGRGSQPEFADLVVEASGAPLSCDAFFAHLAERYGVAAETADT